MECAAATIISRLGLACGSGRAALVSTYLLAPPSTSSQSCFLSNTQYTGPVVPNPPFSPLLELFFISLSTLFSSPLPSQRSFAPPPHWRATDCRRGFAQRRRPHATTTEAPDNSTPRRCRRPQLHPLSMVARLVTRPIRPLLRA